ncbi:TrkH family potassium uptake protein [Neobacillus sp. 179-C4.2 HS]|jgi:Trk-type K+ transport system membrane component|uniref:TrkH family potassium uptake protein n=1 Tax=Neobacillus driksii TaxID=3035913 RepID=A0ABV4YN57_9BACI|nr:TrkH family potassium uptake protein [Neobacillus sp. 179.-C4.2 HS]MDP5193575.1 TrkH family potassium uptake protein [Neobacillus sp. 179.-C4.2 HS]
MNKSTKPLSKKRVLSAIQLIVIFYLSALIISTLLLLIPWAHRENASLSFIDALFTSASAVSVTGLSVISIKDTFNNFGIFLLCIILQIGGLGVMSLSTFLWIMIGKKVGLKERQLIMVDQNQTNLSGLVQLAKRIFITIISFEVIGGIILGLRFLKYFDRPLSAFKHGFFGSISATTNAGFDITGTSLIPFSNDYFVQTVIILLMIIGAIGFPVIVEVYEYFLSLKSKRRYHFTLFTKLTTSTFVILTILGGIVIYLLDSYHFFADKSWHAAFFYSLFNSATTKSAGLATMDLNEFTPSNQIFMSVLMFIGGSPSSASGGIRTTTFAIVLLAIFFYARGKGSIKVFRRELHTEDVIKSFIVISTAATLCLVSILILSITEKGTLIQVVFEVTSAFGTNGLSMGLTPILTTFGKILIIFLMFIGRLGIVTCLLILRGKDNSQEKIHYPKEKVTIG